ncbi:MAG: hypothetical protein ABSF08_02810 [Candidatus Cybelea sp.]
MTMTMTMTMTTVTYGERRGRKLGLHVGAARIGRRELQRFLWSEAGDAGAGVADVAQHARNVGHQHEGLGS